MAEASSDAHTRTIYIGGLSTACTEYLLQSVFGQYGILRNCKIINDNIKNGDKFAFIEFEDHATAEFALNAMNGRMILQKKIRVHWASGPKTDSDSVPGKTNPNHFTIFVGDIAAEVTEVDLVREFTKFGDISGCRITKDHVTCKSKSFGFISFTTKEAAQNAITMMNGYWIGSRSIRTNWAQQHQPSENPTDTQTKLKPKPSFHQVAGQAGPNNTTVFCGNVAGVTETMLTNRFSKFGPIEGVRAFPDRKYGFICFANKNAAVKAILEMDGTEWNGDTVRASWGKEPDSMATFSMLPVAPQQHYGEYVNQMASPEQVQEYENYWRQFQAYHNQACSAVYMNQQGFFPSHMYQNQNNGQEMYPQYGNVSNFHDGHQQNPKYSNPNSNWTAGEKNFRN